MIQIISRDVELAQCVYVCSFVDQKLDQLWMIEHRCTVEWSHLLNVRAKQAHFLLCWLHFEHQLDDFNCALSTK